MTLEPLWKKFSPRLEKLKNAKVNFLYDPHSSYKPEEGWVVDSYDYELSAEPPGPPQPGGPWMIAKRIIQEYKFPDPDLIQGIFIPEEPLENRVMLLQGRFLGMTFYFGAKVYGVVDDTLMIHSEPARVWGFGYVTLEGHFEKGRIVRSRTNRLPSLLRAYKKNEDRIEN